MAKDDLRYPAMPPEKREPRASHYASIAVGVMVGAALGGIGGAFLGGIIGYTLGLNLYVDELERRR
jgi:hypothetical protein